MERQGLLVAVGVLILAACGGDDDGGGETACAGAGNICAYMGTGQADLGLDGVAPGETSLYLPMDVTVGPDGRPYVLDWNNHRVRTVIHGRVATVAGSGSLGDAPEGAARSAGLNHPTHLAVSPSGTLTLAAWHNSKVMQLDVEGGTLTHLCGTGARGYAGDGGPAVTAAFDLPVATAFDRQGRMYIADQTNQRIRRIADGVITTVVGPGVDYLHAPAGYATFCADDANPATCAVCLDTCTTCTEDSGDYDCHPVHIKPAGYAGDGGPATEALLSLPFGAAAPPAGKIEMTADDRLLIADTNNHRIRAYDVATGIINTVVGSGPLSGGYAGDGGFATLARLNFPADVAVATDGTIYIADTYNSCVRKVDPRGIISTYAGQCGVRGSSGDGGPATEALLDRPYGVALGDDGELYIADTHNHRVRVVYP